MNFFSERPRPTVPPMFAGRRVHDSLTDDVFEATIKLKHVVGDPTRTVQFQDMLLSDFHSLIQLAFGWYDSHLWFFEMSRNDRFGPGVDDLEWFSPDEYSVADCFDAGKKKFTYLYDMGDSWEHAVSVRRVRGAAKQQAVRDRRSPLLVSGQGATPPEDCGGPWGYDELVELSQLPVAQLSGEQQERLEWYGREAPIDPNAYHANEIQQSLDRMTLVDADDVLETSDGIIDAFQAGETSMGELIAETLGVSDDDVPRAVQVQLATHMASLFGATDEAIAATAQAIAPEAPGAVSEPTLVPLPDDFCEYCDACFEQLLGGAYTPEFFDLCRGVLSDAATRGQDFSRGKPGSWAGAAVNVVAHVNQYVHPYRGDFPTMAEVGKACGVSVQTVQNRGKQLRDRLDIEGPGDIRYTMLMAVLGNFQLRWRFVHQLAEAQGRNPDEIHNHLAEIATIVHDHPALTGMM